MLLDSEAESDIRPSVMCMLLLQFILIAEFSGSTLLLHVIGVACTVHVVSENKAASIAMFYIFYNFNGAD